MSNVLVGIRGTIDVPERKLEERVGRPDDDSDEWYEEACRKAEELCEEMDYNLVLDWLSGDFEFGIYC